MKIAIAQLNPTVGDIEGNLAKALHAVQQATAQGANLILFSELFLTGYPPRDYLDCAGFAERSEAALHVLAKQCVSIQGVCGFVQRRQSNTGKPFFNAAGILAQGKVEAIAKKVLLPSYGVFDEERYFEPGEKLTHFSVLGRSVALTICEDLWNQKDFLSHPYSSDPLEALGSQPPDLLVNISASPFHLGKPALRERLLAHVATKVGTSVVFCNQVGAQDDLLFDGKSGAFDHLGQCTSRGKAFEETLLTVDLPMTSRVESEDEDIVHTLRSALTLGIRDYCSKSGAKGICLGLSGGVDSAVVAALACEALGPANVHALSMPSQFNSAGTQKDARQLAKTLGIHFHEVPIEEMLTACARKMEEATGESLHSLTVENLQPRLRMTLLMAMSNQRGLLLLNTSNKSELAVGYCTQYGDSCGALAPIGDLTKEQVYAIARSYNREIPATILERAPSAELRHNQKDQDTLPEYSRLDRWVSQVIGEGLSPEALIEREPENREEIGDFLSRYARSEYKRAQFPPILRVTERSFGRGIRMPIAGRSPWRVE